MSSIEKMEEDKLEMIKTLNNWKRRQRETKPVMVIINFSGGGTRAASFAFNVLQKLDKDLGGELMQKTFLMCGASGGILGAAYYRELYRMQVNGNEIVIMVGYPASGKSTIAHEIFEKWGYEIISGDVYKTTPKMLKAALPFVLEKKSIVFDATNSSKKKRSEYITFAKKHNYSVRCIHVQTSMDISYKRNKMRAEEDQIPKIAYSVYTKHFEQPSEDEGFTLIKI